MSQPIILHIDTSASTCSIALSHGKTLVAHSIIEDAKDQSAKINSAIQSCFEVAQMSMHQLQALSICNGPGSYTGLRVGLSTAKGICYALDIPLIVHYKHDLIAAEYWEHDGAFIVAITARPGEWYVAAYKGGTALWNPTHMLQDALEEHMRTNKIDFIITDGEMPDLNDVTNIIKINIANSYKIENVINRSISAYCDKVFADLAYLEPFYLKAAFTTQPKSDILRKNSKS